VLNGSDFSVMSTPACDSLDWMAASCSSTDAVPDE
jgi:hypothetical protein